MANAVFEVKNSNENICVSVLVAIRIFLVFRDIRSMFPEKQKINHKERICLEAKKRNAVQMAADAFINRMDPKT